MSRPDLDAIEARANAATLGPWMQPEEGQGSRTRVCDQWHSVVLSTTPRDQGSANAEFIAHARTDIPALVDYARRLEEAVAGLEYALLDCGRHAQRHCTKWVGFDPGPFSFDPSQPCTCGALLDGTGGGA
jgi:hypothetical protein